MAIYIYVLFSVFIVPCFRHINEDKRRAEGHQLMFDIINDIDNCPVRNLSSCTNSSIAVIFHWIECWMLKSHTFICSTLKWIEFFQFIKKIWDFLLKSGIHRMCFNSQSGFLVSTWCGWNIMFHFWHFSLIFCRRIVVSLWRLTWSRWRTHWVERETTSPSSSSPTVSRYVSVTKYITQRILTRIYLLKPEECH